MKLKESISKLIIEKLDLILASGGILLGIFIIFLSLTYSIHQQDIGGTIFIASFLYLLLRKRLVKASETFHFGATRKIIYINNIIFFIAFNFSVWLLYSILYYRPVIYFILVGIACASIALEILYADRKWTGLVLVKILLIGITLYGGIYYEFSDIYGADTHFHNGQTTIYVEKGHIVLDAPTGWLNSYYYFPMFHLLAASTSIISSLNVHDSIFISITFSLVFSVIFVFLIGEKLINAKVGLLAALMLVVGNYRILFGAGAIPMTLGIVYYTIILYLFVVNTPKPIIKRSIVIFLSIILVLTHTIAGFIMSLTIISLVTWKYLHNYLSNNFITKFSIFLNTALVSTGLLIGYWMYAIEIPGRSSLTFFDYSVSALYRALTYDAEFATGTITKISPYISTNYSEYLLDNMGYLIFLGMGLIGTYVWIKNKNEIKTPLCLTMVVMFAFLYGFSLMGMRTIIPTRWFGFVYIFLALVSASGIFKLANLLNIKFKTVTVLIIIFSISFFMVTSTVSNDDNPLYNKEHATRQGNKASELQGAVKIKTIFNGTYGSISSILISQDYNFSKEEGKLYILNKDAFRIPMVFEEIQHRIVKPFILTNEFKIKLESQSNEIYDNGEVWGYLIK